MHLLLLPLRNPSLLVFSVFVLVALTMLCRSLFSVGSLVWGGLSGMAAASDPDYFKYTTVTGDFLQDDPATDAGTFNYVRLLLVVLALMVGLRKRVLD
jgi:hypothetical protein